MMTMMMMIWMSFFDILMYITVCLVDGLVIEPDDVRLCVVALGVLGVLGVGISSF